MASIEIDNLSLSFESEGRKKEIFSNLNAIFPSEGLVSIIGESGSGKSSLLNILGGYLTSYAGEVRWGCPIQQVGFIFQNLYLIDHLNVIDNVSLPLVIYGRSFLEARKKGKECLALVGLEELAERKISQLSGGQKARVSLARGLALDNQIVLADEPTGSLDSENSAEMMRIFKKLSQDRLIVIVTHNEKLAFEFSDEVFTIDSGVLKKLSSSKAQTAVAKEVRDFTKGHIKMADNIHLAFSFLKSRFLSIISSLLFTSVCLGLIMMLISLNTGGKKSIESLGRDCFDYTCLSLAENRHYDIPGQEMDLLKKVRLSVESQKALKEIQPAAVFYPSFDYLLPSFPNVAINGDFLEENCFLTPSFPIVSRLKEGRIPSLWSEVVVNEAFLGLSKEKIGIGNTINIKNDVDVRTTYYGQEVHDILSFDFPMLIVGISKEKNLLSRASIYYDYEKMGSYLNSIFLKKASETFATQITIKERMGFLADDDDELTAFKSVSFTPDPLFLKETIDESFPDLDLFSLPLEMTVSLEDIISSFSEIVVIFIVLALVCSFLLEQVVIETIYRQKKEEMAVYLSFHISKQDFFRIGLGQIFIFSFTLILLSALFALIFIFVGNKLLLFYGLGAFLNPFSDLWIWALMPCLSYLFAYFSGEIPLRPIYSTDLVLSLKGE